MSSRFPDLRAAVYQDLQRRVYQQQEMIRTPPRDYPADAKRTRLSTGTRVYRSRRLPKTNPTQGLTARAFRPRRNLVPRPEVKNIDTDVSISFGGSVTWHTPQTLLTMPSQTSGEHGRVGNRIYARWMDVFVIFSVNSPVQVPVDGNLIVTDIWLDKRSNAATAASSDIYDSPTEGVLAAQNSANYNRFKRLTRFQSFAEVQSLNAGGAPNVVNVVGYHQYRIPLNMQINSFDAATSKLDNNIIMTCSVRQANVGNCFNMVARSVMYYTDA